MTDSEPKTPAERKPAASKAAPKATTTKSAASAGAPKPASRPRAAAPNAATSPAAESKAPPPLGGQPDEAPIPPRNRHERRSAGKKRPGQAPFKWPPIGPERP